MASLPVDAPAVCGYVDCSVPLVRVGSHAFCFCHAACWVDNHFHPDACPACSAWIDVLLNGEGRDVQQAAAALLERSRRYRFPRRTAGVEALEQPFDIFSDPGFGRLVSECYPSIPSLGFPSVSSAPTVPSPKRLRSLDSDTALGVGSDSSAALGAAPSTSAFGGSFGRSGFVLFGRRWASFGAGPGRRFPPFGFCFGGPAWG